MNLKSVCAQKITFSHNKIYRVWLSGTVHPDGSKSPDPIEETHYQFFDFRFSLRQGSGNETKEF